MKVDGLLHVPHHQVQPGPKAEAMAGPTKFPAIPAAREQTGGIEESGLQL